MTTGAWISLLISAAFIAAAIAFFWGRRRGRLTATNTTPSPQPVPPPTLDSPDPIAMRALMATYEEEIHLFQTVFKSAPFGMLLLDDRLAIVRANDLSCQMADCPPQLLLEKQFGSAFRCINGYANSEGCGFSQQCRSCIARSRITSVLDCAISLQEQEFPIARRVGDHIETAWINFSGELIRLGGRNHVLIVLTDITEQKISADNLLRAKEEAERTNLQLEQATARANTLAAMAEMANAAKTVFLANISHEIRTPMNGVIGMLQLLSETPLTPDQQEYISHIRSSADILLRLINDILDLSKIESGKLALEKVDFNLLEVMEQISDLLAPMVIGKKIEFSCFVEPAAQGAYQGDPIRLRQILVNLISNALKFTQEGEVAVLAEIDSESDDKTTLRFSVRDTGVGIPVEARNRLFQSFSQVDSSTSRRFGGTGLGLAISKQLVELMGGRIGFESAPGKGSLFWCTMVFSRNKALSAEKATWEKLFRNRRTLIIEPISTVRQILIQWLQLWGMRVESAATMADALELLEKSNNADVLFDTILFSPVSAEESEIENFLNTVRVNISVRKSHIVLLLPPGDKRRHSALSLGGIAAILNKPLKHTELRHTLISLLENNSTQDTTPAEKATTPEPESKKRERPRLLLAEDNLINQTIAVRLLEGLGYSVFIVNNGREAVAAVAQNHYDLVLMDCQMPEMNGFEATKILRTMEANTGRRLPIIAMTASDIAGDKKNCTAAGMDDYLLKPVSMDALKTTLDRWLLPKEQA